MNSYSLVVVLPVEVERREAQIDLVGRATVAAGPPFHLQNSGPTMLSPSCAVCWVNVSSGGTWK